MLASDRERTDKTRQPTSNPLPKSSEIPGVTEARNAEGNRAFSGHRQASANQGQSRAKPGQQSGGVTKTTNAQGNASFGGPASRTNPVIEAANQTANIAEDQPVGFNRLNKGASLPPSGTTDLASVADRQPKPESNIPAGFKSGGKGSFTGNVLRSIGLDKVAELTPGYMQDAKRMASDGNHAQAAGRLVSGVVGPVVLDAVDIPVGITKTVGGSALGFAKGLFGMDDSAEKQGAIQPPSSQVTGGQDVSKPSSDPVSSAGQQPQSSPEGVEVTADTAASPADPSKPSPGGNITMTTNEDGITTLSGHNVGTGATFNGKPFSNPVNVVSSDGMKRLAAAVDAQQARGFGPRAAPAAVPAAQSGFKPQQNYRPTPKSGFEKMLDRETYRQATTAHPGSQNGQLTANQLNALRGLRGDIASERTGIDLQAMRNDGMLNQTAMVQSGQNQRDAARMALDTSKFASDQYAQSFQVRQNERLEGLREAYMTAETDDQRSAIAEQLRILNGNSEQGAIYDSKTVNGVNANGDPIQTLYTINQRTGQAQAVSWPEPTPANIAALKKDPKSAALFDVQFGPGAAARYGVGS